jgi:hypothetical protein
MERTRSRSISGCATFRKLASLGVPDANFTTAKTYAGGAFVGPPNPFSGADESDLYKKLPAFCRVVAVAAPTSDSNITIEVWMPLAVERTQSYILNV